MPRINHLALFQFKPECTAEDIELVRRTIADLKTAIPGIVAFNWSPDVSTEGLTEGFTHSFIFTFESVAARDAYLPHPVHQAAVQIVVPRLARVIVLDQIVG
jgi:Stress responsive A/B Barrel Domain